MSKVKVKSNGLDYTVVSKLTDEVTHVVVNLHPERGSCTADLIYFTSILMGKWIVDYKWFEECLKEDNFVDEKEYSTKGSHDCLVDASSMARKNLFQRKPRLFDGCHFYFKGQFSDPYPVKVDLMALIKSGGGVVLKREPDPEGIPSDERRLPYHSRFNSPLAQCSHYIIYQEGLKEPLLKYDMKHVKSLPTAWMIECIKTFSLVDPFK